jgi:glucose-6-phosphate isomerase
MTSICPKDHHSMMQLYIDGPRDKFFNIYEPNSESHFEKFEKFELGKIENKSPSNLLKSQFLGLVQTFREKKIPFKIISINHSKSSRLDSILQLLSYNILETIILGYAQNIDPYDQPAVEQIKLNTFKV